jgi:hypothetical protein
MGVGDALGWEGWFAILLLAQSGGVRVLISKEPSGMSDTFPKSDARPVYTSRDETRHKKLNNGKAQQRQSSTTARFPSGES